MNTESSECTYTLYFFIPIAYLDPVPYAGVSMCGKFSGEWNQIEVGVCVCLWGEGRRHFNLAQPYSSVCTQMLVLNGVVAA